MRSSASNKNHAIPKQLRSHVVMQGKKHLLERSTGHCQWISAMAFPGQHELGHVLSDGGEVHCDTGDVARKD